MTRAGDGQISSAGSSNPAYKMAKENFEKGYLIQLLSQAKGNVVQAAKLAQRYRGDFYRLMKKYGLKAEDFK
jgi:two-component system response regulator GlrR